MKGGGFPRACFPILGNFSDTPAVKGQADQISRTSAASATKFLSGLPASQSADRKTDAAVRSPGNPAKRVFAVKLAEGNSNVTVPVTHSSVLDALEDRPSRGICRTNISSRPLLT